MVYKTKKRISRKPLSKKYGKKSKKVCGKSMKKTMKKKRRGGKKMTQRGGETDWFFKQRRKEGKSRHDLREEIIALGFKKLTKEMLSCDQLEMKDEKCKEFLFDLKNFLDKLLKKSNKFEDHSTEDEKVTPNQLQEHLKFDELKNLEVNLLEDALKNLLELNKIIYLMLDNTHPKITNHQGRNEDFTINNLITIIKSTYEEQQELIKKEKRKNECKNCKKCKYIYDTHHSGVRDWDENVTKDEKCPSADTMEQNNAGWSYVTYQGEDTKLCDECVEETRTSAIAAANELKAAGNNTLFNLNNASSASIANN